MHFILNIAHVCNLPFGKCIPKLKSNYHFKPPSTTKYAKVWLTSFYLLLSHILFTSSCRMFFSVLLCICCARAMIVCDLSPSAVEDLVCVWNTLLILCVCPPAKLCEYIVKLHHTLLVLNCVNILYNYIMLYWCCHTICVLNMTPHIPVTYISHLHGMPISNIVFTIHHNTLPPIDPCYKFPKDIFSGKPLTFWRTRPYCAKSEIWQGSRWWFMKLWADLLVAHGPPKLQ